MGIQNFNSREVAQNQENIAAHFSSVLGTKLLLIVAFIGFVLCGAVIVGYPQHYFALILGVGAIMSLQSMNVYLRSHFSALGHYGTDSCLSGLDKLLMIIVLGYFIYLQKDITITKFIYGQLVALVLAMLIVLVLLGGKIRLGVNFSLEKSKALLKKSFPFAVVFILMTLYTRMDGVMLERLLDDDAASAGIYAKAYRLLDAANILGYLFAMLLLPMFATKLGKNLSVLPLLRSATGTLMSLTTITSVSTWYYAPEILTTIYTEISEVNVEVFRLLMLSFWFMTMAYLYGSLITASGELKIFNMIFVIGIFMNWGLNLYWIPTEGPVGAAKATLITQSFVFLGQFLLAKSKFSLTYPMGYIFKTVIFMFFSFVLFYILSQKLTILWFFEAIIGVIILLIASILLGFFRFSFANEN